MVNTQCLLPLSVRFNYRRTLKVIDGTWLSIMETKRGFFQISFDGEEMRTGNGLTIRICLSVSSWKNGLKRSTKPIRHFRVHTSIVEHEKYTIITAYPYLYRLTSCFLELTKSQMNRSSGFSKVAKRQTESMHLLLAAGTAACPVGTPTDHGNMGFRGLSKKRGGVQEAMLGGMLLK